MDVATRQVIEQTVFTAVPLVFALLHFLLYAFSRRAREHLVFAALTATFAVAAYCEFELSRATPGSPVEGVQRTAVVIVVALGVFFYYELHRFRATRLFGAFLAVALLGIAVGWAVPGLWIAVLGTVVAMAALLVLRHRVTGIEPNKGRWILHAGLLMAAAGGVLDLAIDFGLPLPDSNPWLYGALGLLVAMSVYLAFEMANTQRQLEARLVEVQELSEQMLSQERAAREREIERRLLEADNQRKTEELEQARQLQLSLLPRELPQSKNWDLAAKMITATEVGGDYYDFAVDERGALTVAIGDAVGHGARAGALVAATKSLFLARAIHSDVASALASFHEAMRSFASDRSFVALLLASCAQRRLTVASAGVPPPLVLRTSGAVEEIDVGGTPLGSPLATRYRAQEIQLAPGDLVLLTTDGLPELPDQDGAEFGYTGLAAALAGYQGLSPEHVVARLVDLVEERLGGQPPPDDVTIVALRAC